MILTPLIEADFEFNFDRPVYRLEPEQRVFARRDPENLCEYGPQNHPLPPFEPKEAGR
ncbi:hypothetical protein [uncultured Ruegeria sp.]|uniref:hypothetical protein n=1 Tax=uncultured Ruegeria sp. TaxID=259304 RepID=UPI00262343D2|nr:hypothetical protein [uncultured Ruegeria sp.]